MTIALALLRRFWPYIAGAVAVFAAILWFNHWKAEFAHQNKVEQHAYDLAQYTAAQNKAHVEDLEHARKVETKNADITKGSNDALPQKLADNRQHLADFVRLHRASGAPESGGGGKGVPGAPDSPNGADQHAVVPVGDLEACSDAVTRLQASQDWWANVEAAPK